jgi:hypothetical protein
VTALTIILIWAAIGSHLAVALAKRGDPSSWCSFVFFAWPLMTAVGIVVMLIFGIASIPGRIACYVTGR